MPLIVAIDPNWFPEPPPVPDNAGVVLNFYQDYDLLGQPGVRVTCVYPGVVKSEMTAKNDFPMPFLMETDAAVDLMGKGILRGDTELTFPWQLALPTRLVKVLPNPLFDAAARRLR